MKNTILAEYWKLRTIVSHWVLAIVALAFPLVVVTLVAIFGDFGSGVQSDELASLIAGLAVVSAMVLGAMATISLTGDYGHNTIRPTYAATPIRWRVIASKLLVNSTVILVVSAIAVFGSWVIASLILSGRGQSISIGDDGIVATLLSVLALAVIVSVFGFGLGLVIRNSPVTITVLLLWPLLIESLLGLVLSLIGWDGANKWLPYQAAITAVGNDSGIDDVLGRPWGLVYFAAVSSVIVGVGVFLDQRRDA